MVVFLTCSCALNLTNFHVQNWSDFFSRRHVQFSTHVVCSDQSTAIDATHKLGGCRDDILAAMKLITDAMGRSVAANKFLFFNFSGHGTQIRDVDGDEADGFDEALCPCDFESAGVIVDDDLSQWLEILPSHQLFAVCDCCHSGTCLDLGEFSGFFCSGCRDDQVSADAKSLGSTSGALTACLIHALSSGDCGASEVAARVSENLLQCAFNQKPVMTCTTSSVLDGWGTDFPKAAVKGLQLVSSGTVRNIGQTKLGTSETESFVLQSGTLFLFDYFSAASVSHFLSRSLYRIRTRIHSLCSAKSAACIQGSTFRTRSAD
jgi:hypothetical protein